MHIYIKIKAINTVNEFNYLIPVLCSIKPRLSIIGTFKHGINETVCSSYLFILVCEYGITLTYINTLTCSHTKGSYAYTII